MNSRRAQIGIAILIAIAAVFFFMNRRGAEKPASDAGAETEVSEQAPSQDGAEDESSESASGSAAAAQALAANASAPPIAPISAKERAEGDASAKTFIGLMVDFDGPRGSPKEFLKRLSALGLNSLVQRNDDELGQMMTIRTKESLPGTRYLHAQFMSKDDDDGSSAGGGFNNLEAQHLSFELPASPDALERGVALLRSMVPTLGQPVVTRPDFVMFRQPECVTYWVLRPSVQEALDDPHNPHTVDDYGYVKVAREIDPHCHHEDEGH